LLIPSKYELIIRPSYALENIYKILTNPYDFNYLTSRLKDFENLYEYIIDLLRKLFSINLSRGYISDCSIFNKSIYYIIAEYAEILVDPVIFEKLNAINKIKVFN